MKRTTMAQSRLDRGQCQRNSLLLVAICVIFSLSTAVTVHACDTGIRGTVLWGLTKPGPSRPGQKDEAPLSASFAVFDADNKVADFKSDRSGRFEVALPPGEYTIAPDKSTPVPFPESQKTQVTVPEDGFAVVTIRLETGMK
ncbi:MAG: hypothetical protein ACR2RD_11005 [Woeseiaceae bacterium]